MSEQAYTARPKGAVLACTLLCLSAIAAWGHAAAQERASLRVSDGFIHYVALSPDDKYLALSLRERDSTIQILDVRAQKIIHTFSPPHTHLGAVLCFSPDGKTLATSSDGTVKLWDVGTWKQAVSIERPHTSLFARAFSSDGKSLVMTGGETQGMKTASFVCLWDIEKGKEVFLKKAPNGATANDVVSDAALTPDGATLITSSRDNGLVKLWDVQTGKEVADYQAIKGRGVYAIAVSRDGKTLAASGHEDGLGGVIVLYDLVAKKELFRLRNMRARSGTIDCLSFSPDGKYLISNGRAELQIWDVAKDYKLTAMWEGRDESLNRVVFTNDGKSIISAGRGAITLWNVPEELGQERVVVQEWPVEKGARIRAALGSPDGRLVAFHLPQERQPSLALMVVGVQDEIFIPLERNPGIFSLAFAPNGEVFAVGAEDVTARLWRVSWRAAGAPGAQQDWASIKRVKKAIGASSSVWEALAFSPDSAVLAAAEKDRERGAFSVKLWDVTTGKERLSLPGHKEGVNGLAFTPDGRTLVTAGRDGTIKLWNLEKGKETATLEAFQSPVLSLALSPDGKQLAVGGAEGKEGVILLFDLPARKRTHRFVNEKKPMGPVSCLCFSPDGKYLASGGRPELQLWDVSKDYKLKAMLVGHDFKSVVCGVGFADGGKTVLTAGTDNTIRVWDMPAFKED